MMREQEITINDEERALLERIRLQQGLASIDDAAEWLIKSRLRRSARQITGRGRAMYLIEKKA